MKAIMIMFDSLNKRYLPNYGNEWIKTPNFERLSKKTLTFDNFYGGSMPCMPARRELHTGRYNFLHRSWGPLEPFDISMPELLKKNGIYTHLVTDHYHYFEDGGATYHGRYNSWELFRGQEGDPWKGHIDDIDIPEYVETVAKKPSFKQNWINRQYQKEEKNQSITKTFEAGIQFIKTNINKDNWFLQLETFDPHEPFVSPEKYKDLYPHDYDGKHFDWPSYSPVVESDDVVEHAKYEYAALVSMCDTYLGKVLDMMDDNNMWEDTMLIVNTDHGFLLGEHEWWGKNFQPFYNELINTPFFLWDPRSGKKNEQRSSLAQTIDIAPTLLEFFDVDIPSNMEGRPLNKIVKDDSPIRETALFGMHGFHVNITDGTHTYMRSSLTPSNGPIYEYTLMPTAIRSFFNNNQLKQAELCNDFAFTNGIPVLKIPTKSFIPVFRYGNRLFNVKKDWEQQHMIDDLDLELEMIDKLRMAMIDSEAPIEQFNRLGLKKDESMTKEELIKQKEDMKQYNEIDLGMDVEFVGESRIQLLFLLDLVPDEHHSKFKQLLISNANNNKVDSQIVEKVAGLFLKPLGPMKDYFLHLVTNIHRGLK